MELERADDERLLDKPHVAAGGRRDERKDWPFAVAFAANLAAVAFVAVRGRRRRPMLLD